MLVMPGLIGMGLGLAREVAASPVDEGEAARIELPNVEDGPAPKREAPIARPLAVPLAPRSSPQVDAVDEKKSAPPPRVDAASAETLRVALGLAPESPGTAEERALLELLRSSVEAGDSPPRLSTLLEDGSDIGRRTCREGGADLIIAVGHLADRPDPVLVPYDCRLDLPLGVRAPIAASDPDLVAALWAEHEDLVARGLSEKGGGLTKKARTGLIATGASLLIIGAVAAILVGVLRSDTTVLKVEPE